MTASILIDTPNGEVFIEKAIDEKGRVWVNIKHPKGYDRGYSRVYVDHICGDIGIRIHVKSEELLFWVDNVKSVKTEC